MRIQGGRARVDRSRNLGSIISNEIVLSELARFLSAHYPLGGGGAVLDLGAGTKPYAPLYERHFASCTSVDVPHSPHDVSGVDVLASADALPFPDASFDCVICTEVLEHCPDPRAVLRDVHRVLKPGGRAFFTTPFLVPLHELPYDFFRYTPPALELLATEAGFVEIVVRPKGDYVAVALTVLQLPLTKLWQRLAKLVRINLYHPYNPFVLATVLAPQVLYVALWKRVRRRDGGRLRRLSDKLSYYTLGYVTTLAKSA